MTQQYQPETASNTAYTLRAYALALRDILLFGRNVVYAGTIRRNRGRRVNEVKKICWM